MNGRNFLDLALLVPGVSPTNVASTQLFAETSAVPGGGLSVGSQRNLSNNFIVDGLSANDDAAALSGIPVRRRCGGSVPGGDVGRAGGARTRARRLLQRRHEERHEPARAAISTATSATIALQRRERADRGTTLPMSQQQVGGSIGGPIARDRTFYFTNLERRNLDQSGLTTIPDENVAPINARLAAVGYPGAPVDDRHLSPTR